MILVRKEMKGQQSAKWSPTKRFPISGPLKSGWCVIGPQDRVPMGRERNIMWMHIYFQPILALMAGILILVMPRLLSYIVALFLILYGIMGLLRAVYQG